MVKSIDFGIKNSSRGIIVLPVTSYVTLGRWVTWVSHLPNREIEKIKWDYIYKALGTLGTLGLAQNKPSNYHYYLKLWELSVHFPTLGVKVFPSAKLGGWTQFLRFLCTSTSLQFFQLNWPQQPFFPPIITCIYRALLTSESFISIISLDSHHHSVRRVGREGSIILIWLAKKMRHWEVVTCQMLVTKSKLEEPGTYSIIPGFFRLSNMACLSVSSTLFQPRNMKNS